MKYILLIYDEEKNRAKLSENELNQMRAEYTQLTQQITASGHYVTGAPLQPTRTATSVRVRDGKRLVTDGPFAETKEQLGGYYLIEAKDLDDAIAVASRIPSVRWGSIEVRPIIFHPMP